ncbi:MAG: hypothetical protein FWC16_03455 [Defluviitaleaceae bacterium]|nr:hypothetical protein [Defluviitaleaceae bacterium]MCL2273959.1 hypothetical protein [Defluviitaleaceae bacterium]
MKYLNIRSLRIVYLLLCVMFFLNVWQQRFFGVSLFSISPFRFAHGVSLFLVRVGGNQIGWLLLIIPIYGLITTFSYSRKRHTASFLFIGFSVLLLIASVGDDLYFTLIGFAYVGLHFVALLFELVLSILKRYPVDKTHSFTDFSEPIDIDEYR